MWYLTLFIKIFRNVEQHKLIDVLDNEIVNHYDKIAIYRDALVYAVQNNYKCLIDVLFDRKVKYNSFELLTSTNDKSMVEYLVKKGVDINDRNNYGELYYTHNFKQNMNTNSFYNININHQNNSGETMLICACRFRSFRSIIQLFEYKDIDVNIRDKHGLTALYYSCSNNKYGINLDVCKKIIEHPDTDVNQAYSCKTILMQCCDHDIIGLLLKRKDIDIFVKYNNMTALTHSIKDGDFHKFKLLLEKYSEFDFTQHELVYILDSSVKYLRCVLNKFDNIKYKRIDDKSLLDYVVFHEKTSHLNQLLRYGLKPTTDALEFSLIYHRNYKIINLLLKYNVRIPLYLHQYGYIKQYLMIYEVPQFIISDLTNIIAEYI